MARRQATRSATPRRTAQTSPAPSASPAPHTAAAVIFIATTIAAFVERRFFSRAWGEAGSLTSAFYYGDANRFVEYAVAIVQGRLFDNGIPFHPPGWPGGLAAFLRLMGAVQGERVVVPVATIKTLVASLSALAVGITAALAYELAGLWAMIAVSFLGTFHFGHIVEGAVANSEAFYTLCLAAFMWTSWHWIRSPQPRWAAATGVAGAAATLVRPEFLACALVVAVFVWRAGERERLLAFACAFCLMLVPTTIWHWRTLSAFNVAHVGRVAGPLPRFAPVTSYGPFNFAMANHAEADGGPNRDHPMLDRCDADADASLSAGQLDLACQATYELYVDGYRIGAAWLLDEPGRALALMGRKIGYTMGFLEQGYLIDDVGAGVDGVRRRVDMIDPGSGWLLAIHLFLAAAGAAILWRRPPALIVTIAPLAALAGSVLLFYGYVRVGVAYLPAIWILQGTALAAGLSRALSHFGAARRLTNLRIVTGTLVMLTILLSLELARLGVPRAIQLDGARDRAGRVVQDETLYLRRAGAPK